jgi:hypothetical protein
MSTIPVRPIAGSWKAAGFRACLLAIMLTAATAGIAQPMASVIKGQAMEMGKALAAGDVETFSRFMHPSVIKMAGGKEKVREMADTMNKVFKQFGGSVTRILIGNPAKVISYRKTLQTTLPQTTSIETSFADIEVQSTLVAISNNQGKDWYFIDTSIYQESKIRSELPEISPDLVIPPPAKPKMTPKNQ